jgi:cell division septation protein DedD
MEGGKMKKVFIPILILSLLVLFFACSKDKDVQQLENETREAETTNMETDTTAAETSTGETMDTSEEQYAMTPETTPEEEPMGQPTTDYSGMGGFTVQVGSGTDYDNAEYLMKKYQDRGYDAFITQANIGGELVYRIRIGNYTSYSEAKALALELQDKYSAKFWIAINE